ncbi:hypothetical protein RT97_05165 [Variovorax paradoxus]|uniref:Uncharacterized protein n=1 Tax=Variovorax paradoxus TaxID=34073 RepID=A0A0D0LAK2_VARPD|nr:hypothetical protein RT97_05165 [Variovorax paradoxus]
MSAALAFEQVHVQFPIGRMAHLQAQWRRGRFVLCGRRPTQEDRAVAAVRADLKAPDLFLTGLRQP